jgi:hypothetical protein
LLHLHTICQGRFTVPLFSAYALKKSIHRCLIASPLPKTVPACFCTPGTGYRFLSLRKARIRKRRILMRRIRKRAKKNSAHQKACE